VAAIPGHLIGPRQRKNISRQIGHERRGARPSSTPPSCSSAYGAGRVPDPALRRRRPHPPPPPQPLSWLEHGRRSPRLVGGLLRTGHRRHHGTPQTHCSTGPQDPAGSGTSSTTTSSPRGACGDPDLLFDLRRRGPPQASAPGSQTYSSPPSFTAGFVPPCAAPRRAAPIAAFSPLSGWLLRHQGAG